MAFEHDLLRRTGPAAQLLPELIGALKECGPGWDVHPTSDGARLRVDLPAGRQQFACTLVPPGAGVLRVEASLGDLIGPSEAVLYQRLLTWNAAGRRARAVSVRTESGASELHLRIELLPHAVRPPFLPSELEGAVTELARAADELRELLARG